MHAVLGKDMWMQVPFWSLIEYFGAFSWNELVQQNAATFCYSISIYAIGLDIYRVYMSCRVTDIILGSCWVILCGSRYTTDKDRPRAFNVSAI